MERLMTHKEFINSAVMIRVELRSLDGAKSKEAKIIRATIAKQIDNIRESFIDKDNNFVKWLHGEVCSFVHPETGNRIDVQIGDDYEAIYDFLIYCRMLNEGEKVDDCFAEYLAYLISRSNYEKEDC